ncbi:hypothetical protein H7F15_10930 [Pontibacter sp. Tf4]|uniref:hypothetical protein n=1 Tax=Pontibacter sp. Tf4 TaxID=2761620 RepID=UPI001626DF49|nr:hypothetical protein [Pontibacter sp. Tf4]MBB6611551.1 hypothetical protein [Pontibacter sp. Tf4]
MRLVTVKAPSGQGKNIAQIAFESEIEHVSILQSRQYSSNQSQTELDVVEIETATPKARKFLESLMVSSIYDPETFTFSVRHPESIFGDEPPKEETWPIVRPTTDVYQELWQFTQVTKSLVGRVFLSAILLAYGMVEDMLPLIIAGLLFLPYHHHMLGIGLGIQLREWRFLWQGLLALLVTTVLIVAAGACVALFTNPPIGFEEFGTPLAGIVLSAVIGIAAALAAMDDAGRRELIGLAATAHISVYPAWFGLKLIFGFDAADTWAEHLLTFSLNISTLILAACLTFLVLGMKGKGIRRFARR